MRPQFFALVVSLAGCSASDTDTISFETVRSMAGELPIAGIESDHEGGVWIAYQLPGADFYDNDETRVVHLDAGGAKTREFIYTDEFTDVSGIALSDEGLWLNYSGNTTGNFHVRKLDPETGERIGSFAMSNAIMDVDVHADELRLSYQWNQIIALDRATGGERWRTSVSAFGDGGTQRGIASLDDGRIWVASWTNQKLYLVGPDGASLGFGGSEHLDDVHVGDGLHLAWDGTHVLLAVDGHIHWLLPQL